MRALNANETFTLKWVILCDMNLKSLNYRGENPKNLAQKYTFEICN